MKWFKLTAISLALFLSVSYGSAATVTKGLIGAQDIHQVDGTATKTFTRASSTGGTLTLNDVDYEVDALVAYGGGVVQTGATLMSACTAVGSRTETIVVRPGTWTISANTDFNAVCPNATFKIAPGALLSHGAFTVNIPNLDAGRYQVFSGTGAVTLSGTWDAAFPEWWGAKGDGTTNSTAALNAAAIASQKVSLAIGTYMTDGLVVNGAGNVWSGAAGYDNSGISSLVGTRIKARGTQAYVLSTISRFSLFENIIFDGAWTTTTVVRIYVPSLHIAFKHCTFMATLDDTAAGSDGSSGGKLVYDDSTAGGTVASTQGDNMVFEDCVFTSGDSAGVKTSAESLNIGGSNAFLNTINRCMFYYARIHISFTAGGGRVTNSEFENYTLAAIYYVGASAAVTVDNNYTEQTGTVTFFKMTAQSAIVANPVILRNNQVQVGTLLLYLGQPITLENNVIVGAVQLEPPGILTPYYRVLAINNNLQAGFTGTDSARVIQIGNLLAPTLATAIVPLALGIGVGGSVGTFDLTINSATTVVSSVNIRSGSYVLLTAASAAAAADTGSATGVWVTSIVNETSFTVTHPNSATAGRTFNYMIIN